MTSNSTIIVEDGIEFRRHANGGGLVALTACAEDSVYVSSEARIYNAARVRGNTKVRDSAKIYGEATVSDSLIEGSAEVYGYAIVTGAKVRGNAKIYGEAAIEGESGAFSPVIEGSAEVYGCACVYSDADPIYDGPDAFVKIRGNAKVHGHTAIHHNAEIYGDAAVCGDMPNETHIEPLRLMRNTKIYGNAKIFAGPHGNHRISDIEICEAF
jgi:predicted acyltransferase (DUF342 family)